MSKNEKVMNGDVLSMASDMKKLVNAKDMSDIKFIIGPSRKTVYAHRCILAARCEVFRAMFADQNQQQRQGEVPFVLSDMPLEVFLPMIEYIYTNCVSLNSKVTVDVLGCSIEYGLDGLRELCVEYLVENLSVNNACEAMQAAVTFGSDQLYKEALAYIEQNTQKVFQSKAFHEMSDSTLAAVLQSDDLDIDESDIITAVREWANVNSVVLGKSVSQVSQRVVEHIRLPLLSPEELKDLEEQNKKDNLLSVDQISYAWKCHALKMAEKGNPHTRRRNGTVSRESHKAMHIS